MCSNMRIRTLLFTSLLFAPFAVGSIQVATAAILDGAVYQKEVLHQSLVKSREPALGDKMDVQVIAARHTPETHRTYVLLKASDLDIKNERYKDSPLLLRDDDANEGTKMVTGYGLEPGFNIVVTEHGKVIPGSVLVKPLGFYNTGNLVLISYDSYDTDTDAANPTWNEVRIKLGLPKVEGYTYVSDFDLHHYETSELDPAQPFAYLYKIADRQLNYEYQSTLTRLHAANHNAAAAQLRSSERDWVKFKEQQCAPAEEDAAMVGQCRFEATVDRISYLREIK